MRLSQRVRLGCKKVFRTRSPLGLPEFAHRLSRMKQAEEAIPLFDRLQSGDGDLTPCGPTEPAQKHDGLSMVVTFGIGGQQRSLNE